MSLQARLRSSSPFFLVLALAFSSSLVASDAVAQNGYISFNRRFNSKRSRTRK